MATAINYTSTAQSGKKLNKTITAINPDAVNAHLKTFAQMLNGLTTNIYGSTSRIDKDELVAASSLTAPTVIIHKPNGDTVSGSITWDTWDPMGETNSAQDLAFAVSSPGKLRCVTIPEHSSVAIDPLSAENAAEWYSFDTANLDGYSFYTVTLNCPANTAKCLGNFVFTIAETDGFAQGNLTISVVAP